MKRMSRKIITTLAVLLAVFTVSAAGWAAEASMKTGQTGKEEASDVAVPVIMYHHILKDRNRWGDYIISPAEFEADLQYITEAGYTSITVEQLIAYVTVGVPLPEKPIILSFDDGHRSFYAYAAPLLEQYGQRAVVAVVGEYSEQYSETDDHNVYYAYMSWEEIAEVSRSGAAEIQNHSYALHDNTGKRSGAKKMRGESTEEYAAVLWQDIEPLQEKLEAVTGKRPNTFVYPFGAVSAESAGILREMGFAAAFDCESKLNRFRVGDTDALMEIHRVNRRHGYSAEAILAKLMSD